MTFELDGDAFPLHVRGVMGVCGIRLSPWGQEDVHSNDVSCAEAPTIRTRTGQRHLLTAFVPVSVGVAVEPSRPIEGCLAARPAKTHVAALAHVGVWSVRGAITPTALYTYLHVPCALSDWRVATGAAEPALAQESKPVGGDLDERTAILPAHAKGRRGTLDGTTGQHGPGRRDARWDVSEADPIHGELLGGVVGGAGGIRKGGETGDREAWTREEVMAGGEDDVGCRVGIAIGGCW